MTNKGILGTTLLTLLAILGYSFITTDGGKLIREDAKVVDTDTTSTPNLALYTPEYVDSINRVLDQKNTEGYTTIAKVSSAGRENVARESDFDTPHRSTWKTSMRSAPIHKSANGQMLKGIASYYHDKFVGRKTANGEIFSQNKYTCACNSLPLGTYLRVTNLKNDKSVVVKVNDRLAKHNKRVVDLSKCSARKIGSIKAGLARVKVEVISKDEARQELGTY